MLTLLTCTFSRQMLMQWLHDACKPLNKPSIMSHQAQKGSDCSVGLWWSEFSHSFQVLLAGSYAFLGNIMSQIADLIPEEFTLGWLELQIMLLEVLKHNMQVMQVFPFNF